MSFRADGISVVRSAEEGDHGVALAFDVNTAQMIADALNEATSTEGLRTRKDPLTGERVATLDVRDRTMLGDVLGTDKHVVIVGPYATAEMATPDGRQIRSLAEGSVLPRDTAAGHARHLIDVGLARLVDARSAAEAFEGAPTERHRVEAAGLQVGPTVGRPAAGTVAADYDADPVRAAQLAAAGPGAPVVTQKAGAGEALPGDDAYGTDYDDADGEPPAAVERPPVNAPKAAWVDYAESQGMSREDAEATSKEQLVGRYGR